MKYLKTYENLSTVYRSTKKYLIVSKDEKYVVWLRVKKFENPLLYPIEELNTDADLFFFDYDPTKILKRLNKNQEYAVRASAYTLMSPGHQVAALNCDPEQVENGYHYSERLSKENMLKTKGYLYITHPPYGQENMFKIVEYDSGYIQPQDFDL